MDSSNILVNLFTELPAIQTTIFLVSAAMGIFAIGVGLVQLSKVGSRGDAKLPYAIGAIIIGSLLLSVNQFGDIVTNTTLSQTEAEIVAASGVLQGDNEFEKGLQVLIGIMTVFGWIAIVRGLHRLRIGPLTNSPGWAAQGFTFIIAGVIAANFVTFVGVLEDTTGFAFSNGLLTSGPTTAAQMVP